MNTWLLTGLVFVCFLAVCGIQTMRLSAEQNAHRLTRKEYADAAGRARAFQAAGDYRQEQAAALARLGQACIDREAAFAPGKIPAGKPKRGNHAARTALAHDLAVPLD